MRVLGNRTKTVFIMSDGVYMGKDQSLYDSKYALNSIRKKWELLRQDLIKNKYKYGDPVSAKNSKFLSEFDEVFNKEDGRQFLEVSLNTVFIDAIVLRGAVLKPDDPHPKGDRFIPYAKFITEENRFSPVSVEWLYLALGYPNDELGRKRAIICSQKECRANVGDRYGICRFGLKLPETKVIDLTIGENWTPETQRIELRELVSEYRRDGKVMDPEEMMNTLVCRRNRLYTYAKFLSEALFVPVENCDKHMAYIPFHYIAQYFRSFGYQGIIYKSTVCKGGKNMVLFNKEIANPLDSTIDDYIIE